MKIRTASTRRAIGRWKGEAKAQETKFYSCALALAAPLLASARWGRIVLIPVLILALSLNFAAFEPVILILMGFFIAKFHCYRFVNSMMELVSFG